MSKKNTEAAAGSIRLEKIYCVVNFSPASNLVSQISLNPPDPYNGKSFSSARTLM